MKSAVLELMVDDVKKSVEFYTSVLGFEKKFEVPDSEPFFVSLYRGEIEILFYRREEFSKEVPKFKDMKLGGSFVLNIEVEDVNELYDSVKGKVKVIQDLHQTDYGTLEFSMEDINGYVLLFKQKV
ncbi:MAG: VOC family protein [Candidatus Dojkabacteria bacterium]